MSPHQTSPYQDVKEEYFNYQHDWLASTSILSPQLVPKDEIGVHFNFGLHSSASQYSATPPRSPLIGPRSAPIASPIINDNNSWIGQMFSHEFSNHSFHGHQNPNMLNAIEIPQVTETRSIDSPHTSYTESYVAQNNMTHQDSFTSYASSHFTEPFPTMDDSEYSVSPNIDHKHSWFLDTSVPMDRADSILSNDSLLSQDEDPLSFDDGSVNEFSIISPFGSPLSTKLIPQPRGSNTKMGRKRKLSAAEREATAYMRKIGACETCNKRKLKCDAGIPCKRCVKSWTAGQPNHPCRGKQLDMVANFILQENAFPKRNYKRFLLDDSEYKFSSATYPINLDLGFGTPLPCEVNLIYPTQDNIRQMFLHKHVEYQWPPIESENPREERIDFVFPAVLADITLSCLEQRVEGYLSVLLNNASNFQFFPIWNSELKVLRRIYTYYLREAKGQNSPLEQALKLLILVHVGGDVRVLQDEHSTRIIKHYVQNYNTFKVTPCYIRAQLGPVFSQLSHRLMRNVLTELEILSPSKDPTKFPMVISTFSVLLMAMESLQYHFCKIPYHTFHDNPSKMQEQNREPILRSLDDLHGADILLRFYKATNCSAQIGQIGAETPLSPSVTSAEADPTGFLTDLKTSVLQAKPYLQERLKRQAARQADVSNIFDRLLAKLYLME